MCPPNCQNCLAEECEEEQEEKTIEAVAKMSGLTIREVKSVVMREISKGRIKKITPERRKEISLLAINKRWGK